MIRIHCMKKTPFSKGKKRWGRKLGLTGFRVESKDVNQETQSLRNEQQRHPGNLNSKLRKRGKTDTYPSTLRSRIFDAPTVC